MVPFVRRIGAVSLPQAIEKRYGSPARTLLAILSLIPGLLDAGCRVVDLQDNDLSYNPKAGIKRPGFIVYPSQLDISAGM